MLRAWKIYRSGKGLRFGEALHRAWLSAKAEEINAARIERSRAAAGITEETNTWKGWQEQGYQVMHGAKAMFSCLLIWGSRGDDERISEFLWKISGTASGIKRALIRAATPIRAM